MNSADREIREPICRDIEMLYPPDESEIGKELLIEALCKVWRGMPIHVLRCLQELCQDKDNANARDPRA